MKYFKELLQEITNFKTFGEKEQKYLIEKYGEDVVEEFLAFYYSKTAEEEININENLTLSSENNTNLTDYERYYIKEIQQYETLSKEEEREHLEQIEKYRDFVKEHNLNYETLSNKINNLPEFKNNKIELEETNTNEVIDMINTVSSISSYEKQLLVYQIKAYKLYKQHYNIMFNHNLRLVIYIARKFPAKGLEFLDLVQEGNIGLMTAIDKYETKFGTKFSTYAYWWIKQKITRTLADEGNLIRIPVHFTDKIILYEKVYRNIETNGLKLNFDNLYNAYIEATVSKEIKDKSEEEIIKIKENAKKKVTENQFREIQKFSRIHNLISLNEPIRNSDYEEDNTLMDYVASDEIETEEEFLEKEEKETIINILSSTKIDTKNKKVPILTSKEKVVIGLRYGLDISKFTTQEELEELILTQRNLNIPELLKSYEIPADRPLRLEEIGKIIGVTRERIRQIETKSLRKITKFIKINYKEYYNEHSSNKKRVLG